MVANLMRNAEVLSSLLTDVLVVDDGPPLAALDLSNAQLGFELVINRFTMDLDAQCFGHQPAVDRIGIGAELPPNPGELDRGSRRPQVSASSSSMSTSMIRDKRFLVSGLSGWYLRKNT